MAVDSAGDLFIPDWGNNVVREVVKTTGDIITVAGNGTAGYSGDGGPATAAELDHPNGVAVDSSGDLFIADQRQQRDPGGGQDDRRHHHRRWQRHRRLQRRRRARNHRRAGGPNAVAVDAAGDLFIADSGNNVIREVVKSTGDIITVAGNGTAGYSGDGGPATAAELNGPFGVAIDSVGDLFIADGYNNVIREVVKATGDIITVAGNGTAGYSGDGGPATDAELNDPIGIAIDSVGDLFIGDSGNHGIREVVKATGDIITVAGNGTPGYTGDNGPATDAELNGNDRLTVDSAGDLFIADDGNNVVREVTPAVTVTIVRRRGSRSVAHRVGRKRALLRARHAG